MASLPSPAAPPAPAPDRPVRPCDEVPLDDVQRDKLALMGHMASSIAHELSNPLATIVASAQAILSLWPAPMGRRDSSFSPPELAPQGVPIRQLREDLELILAEARRAGDIVHGLLASARNHPPETRLCWAADVVRRAVALSRHHCKLHNITLQAPFFDPEEGYPLWTRFRGDANQLQQVLLNLIMNAQQAITTCRGFGTIRLTLAADGPDRIVIGVEDDGPGVPDELREAIFRPYFTTKPTGQGTGLGLSISQGLVRAQGGDITVGTRTEGGAVFRIVLPSLAAQERQLAVVEVAPPAAVATLPAAPPAGQDFGAGRRVLLVDDEPGIRRSVSRFLQRQGFQVAEVASAQAALDALRGDTFDAIVSDLRMPGLSGEEFFAILGREIPGMARRVIFTSGDLLRGETQAFLQQSGCPSLEKPYELAELVQLLETLTAPAPARRASA